MRRMAHRLLITALFLYLFAHTGLSEKVCQGTENGLSISGDLETHYNQFKSQYLNCTHINGNLEITDFRKNDDLSFLKDIQEIRGYLLIGLLDNVDLIPLSGLRIIRGSNLYKGYSLYIVSSDVRELQFTSLKEIQYGNVYFGHNGKLCYFETIDWDDLFLPEINSFVLEHIVKTEENQDQSLCPACNETCGGHCWGSGPNLCQTLTQTSCHALCDYRCNGPEPGDCCHRSCAVGCTGSTNSECLACQEFSDDGKCVDDCPPPTIYNPNTFLNEFNPNFKYTYGSQCVEQCPENSVIDDYKCVRSCPNGKYAYDDTNCVECNGPCPMICKGTDSYPSDKYVTANNIDSFKNCTEIDGNIVINHYLFKGDPWLGIPKLEDFSKLDYFSNIWRITGYLKIQTSAPGQTDLSMFRSLREISGRQLYEGKFALDIQITFLEMLGLAALEKITIGSVIVAGNSYMCYLNTPTMWDSILENQNGNPNIIGNNKPLDECIDEGKVCHEECNSDGCWGPGSDMCINCQNYKLGDECVATCDVNNGQFILSSTDCSWCDVECLGNCKGAGPGNCTACKHVTDGPYCRELCPLDKYPDAGNCTACHPNCIDGCTGPANTVGEGGCNQCYKVLLDREQNIMNCMEEEGDENTISCPNNTFSQHIYDDLDGKAEVACQECHEQCLTCDGPDDFHCIECLNKKLESSCVLDCPNDYFSEGIDCQECDSECKDHCRGRGPDKCDACKNFKIDFGGDEFFCVKSCTVSHPYILKDECVNSCPEEYFLMPDSNGDNYCSACNYECVEGCYNDTQEGCFACRNVLQDFSCKPRCDNEYLPDEDSICVPFVPPDAGGSTGLNDSDKIGIIVGSLLGFIFFVVIIIIIVYIKKKRQFYDIPTDYPLEQLDLKTLTPSGAAPNRSTLRLIKETELKKGNILGSGAFGTVYKGLWIPEGDRVRIPVAIKVLREGMSAESSKELLEEAYVMATVDHPCLVRLLCVCMAQQMMMITQLMPCGSLLEYLRANQDKVSSHHLLTWCTQIARGMRYLEEMRLVHRDLAARNVLVKNPAQVKITDFGLSKFLDIHEEEYKAEGGKVAIKWMALECIQYRRFTHQSDVWSYGVTVWELMTFGGRPYEMARARDVPDLLEKGERLPQPSICTIDVYMIMLKCWLLDADTRPTFKELAEDFSKMAKDPQRYLVIMNDGQEPLPSPTKSEFYNSLLPEGGHESLMDAEDYLQPVITDLDMNRSSGESGRSVPPGTDYQLARQSLRTPPHIPDINTNTLDVADDSSSATSTPIVHRSDPSQEYRPQFLDRQLSAGRASAGASNKGSKLFHSPNGERKDRYCSDPLTVLQSQRSRDDSSPKAIPEEDIDGYLAPQLTKEEPTETNRLMESDDEDAIEESPPGHTWNIVENPEYMNQGLSNHSQRPPGHTRPSYDHRPPNGRLDMGGSPGYSNLPPVSPSPPVQENRSHPSVGYKPEYQNFSLRVLPPLDHHSHESLNLSAANSEQSLSKLSDALSDEVSDHEYVNDMPQVKPRGSPGQRLDGQSSV